MTSRDGASRESTTPGPGSARDRSARRGGLLVPALVFLALALAVALAGWAIFARQASDMRAEGAHSLLAVQKLQSSQVATWFTDEVHDTRLLAGTQVIVEGLERSMDGPPGPVPEALKAQLELYRLGHGIASVTVLDPALRGVVQSSSRARAGHTHPPTARTVEVATRALREGRVVFSGVYLEAGDSAVMDFVAPLRDSTPSPDAVIGVVVVHIEAAETLFPLFLAWPPSLRTGESVLAAVQDGRIVAVNPLPVGDRPPLSFSRETTDADLPVAMAVRGRSGIVEGVDYRGAPVLAAVGKVPGTPWYLVAKQDLAVIDQPIADRGWATVAWVAGIILLAGVVLLLYWRSRETRTLRALVDLERERSRAEEHYAALMREAKEIVVVNRHGGTIVEANDWALQAYGYSRDEFIGQDIGLFVASDGELAPEEIARRLREGGGHYAFEHVHRRRDGVEFPVEVGLSTITVDGEELVLAVIRDVGERAAAEAALRDSETRYRTLFENALSGFALFEVVHGEDGEPVDLIALTANPAFAVETGLSRETVVGRLLSEAVPGVRDTDIVERGLRVASSGAPERGETFVPALERSLDVQYASPRRGQVAAVVVDVTAARRAELELKESRAFLKRVLGVTPDVIYIFDLAEQRNVFSNRSMVELLAYTPEDVLEMGSEALARLLHPDDVALMAGHQRDMRDLADGEVLEVEYRMLHADGGWRTLRGRDVVFARDEDGTVTQIIGTAHDVTRRRAAEQELQRLTQRLEATVMASPLAIVAAGPDQRVELWNPAAAAIFGWTADEVVGSELPIIPPDLQPQAEALQRRLLAGEQFAGLDLPCVRKDGERIHTSLSLALMHGARGDPDSALMIFEDVTERRANVVRLARLTRLYQVLTAVTEAIPEEREPERLFEKVCRIVVEQGGFRRAWVGRKRRNGLVQVVASFDAVGPVAATDFHGVADRLGNVGAALAKGQSVTTRDIATDPRTADVAAEAVAAGVRSAAAVPVFIDGRHDTVLAISSGDPGRFDTEELRLLERLAADIGFAVQAGGEEAARRKAERRLEALNRSLERRVRERTDALEAANAELEAFSYSVSHDLRAPLRALDGFSLALLEDYGDRLDGEAEDYLARIRSASQRMAQLIDDLLMLSRVTRRDVTWEEVDLSASARIVAAELAADDPERQVTVHIAENMLVAGDAQLLDVALRNLLGNAWKFTSHTPAAEITVGVEDHAGERAYFVRDNGAGFEGKYADKLFAPFQRLHGEDEFPGTGIGLATVQRIVRRHGGRVWAEGATGKGATVWFSVGPLGEGA